LSIIDLYNNRKIIVSGAEEFFRPSDYTLTFFGLQASSVMNKSQ